jgi:1,4-alpha-glucan branching enzyme
MHIEVLQFLLSDLRYYLDIFRFDSVASIIYKCLGNLYGFASLQDYFHDFVDEQPFAYLYLANYVIHTVYPKAITIAKEISDQR